MIVCTVLAIGGAMLAAKLLHRAYGCSVGPRWAGPCGPGFHHHHHGWRSHRAPFGPARGVPGGWPGDVEFNGDVEGGPAMMGFGRRRGRATRWWLRAAVRHLDATPAQEKVMRDSLEELRNALDSRRGELKKTRADIAGAFRRTTFDEVAMGELYARHDSAIEDVRKAFVGAAARIHEALDEEQRKRLADLIESGPRRGFFRGWREGGGDGQRDRHDDDDMGSMHTEW